MAAPTPSVRDLLTEAAGAISRSRSIDHWQPSLSRYDAEELMAAALETPLTRETRRAPVPAAARQRFARMVARRIDGEPVAQIIGTFEFRGLQLKVRRGVFVPRVSSELLAAEAIKRLRRIRGSRVLVDVATGTGPVALSVAHEVPSASVWGIDISAEAVRLGRENARRLEIPNVRFETSDMLDALPSRLRGQVDVFTIHPPYVARGELRVLPREIRDFEPLHSLTDGSDDGLRLSRVLATQSMEWLRPGGTLLIEIGTYLSRKTQAVLRKAGLADVGWTRDALGVTRVVSGRRPR